LQMVNISLRVLARPDSTTLPHMYRMLGTDYDERVLPSICNEVLKSVVAKFNASQLILKKSTNGVSITGASVLVKNNCCVESKQVAQQEAQRAAFVVEQAKQERQQKIVQAEGEAEVANMISFCHLN
ncbi:Prohibitin-2, partial [Araneus ventricosus]